MLDLCGKNAIKTFEEVLMVSLSGYPVRTGSLTPVHTGLDFGTRGPISSEVSSWSLGIYVEAIKIDFNV